MGPKLVSSNKHKLGKKEVHIFVWKGPKGWSQDEIDICTRYYQLQSKKLGMGLERYMKEFQ